MDQSNVDKARNVKESNINIKQGTGNIEQSGNVEHSKSNVVESMNNDKDNEQNMNNDKDIEQNTVIVEQRTSNVVQSSINVQQSIDVLNNNSDKSSSINIEQNVEVVNDNNNKCSIVNIVADYHSVESLSSEDPPSWAEVFAMEEAATLRLPLPWNPSRYGKPVLFVVPFVLLVLAFLWAFARPPVRRRTLRGRLNRLVRVFFLFIMASSSVFNSPLSVLSLNVDGLRDSLKRAALLQWLHAVPSVDVVCLQEVHCVSKSECQFCFRSS